MIIDARKAHLKSKCEKFVYVKLPEECGCPEGMCAKLNYLLYGFRKAATAWEDHYSKLFESVGFQRGEACGVVFYNKERDISMAVHGDDFTLCGMEEDLVWIRDLMKSWFEIKLRAMLGPEEKDDKEVVLLGRTWVLVTLGYLLHTRVFCFLGAILFAKNPCHVAWERCFVIIC